MGIQLGFGFWTVLVLVLALAFSVLWMRWRMRASKSRFALAVLTSLLTCLSVGIAAATAGLPQVFLAWVLTRLGVTEIDIVPSFITSVLFVAFAGFVAFLIFRFGSTAIKNWEGPLRVSEKPLAENLQDEKLVPLALNGFVTLLERLKGQKDLAARDFEKDWRTEDPQLPNAIPSWVLLRDLFLGCYAEADISDDGWRDSSKLWIGSIADPGGESRAPLLLLICPEPPSQEALESRLRTLSSWTEDKNSRAFAVYPSDHSSESTDYAFVSGDREVRVLSGRALVMNSLDLDFYARQLLSRFASDQIGGTNSTLENTYVDLTVSGESEGKEVTQPVFDLLNEWENEPSRRHLAITGEYGQGKSSAMLKYCADWAHSYLSGNANSQRVPLLIELRGRNPSENDPLAFLSVWCARSRLNPNAVFNLIRSGAAILIFEGFDELRGAGREYDRHQHFNALWRFAYEGVKIIFTGRPNFFIDEVEANRTLRNNDLRGADGGAYTSVYRLSLMSTEQIAFACRDYSEEVRNGITALIDTDENFSEILSRPSMLPVVATIWPKVDEIAQSGEDLNGATLIRLYIDAIFQRKESELERDKIEFQAPAASRYLQFNLETRRILTGGVAWLMAEKGYQNTIARSEIKEYVTRCYDTMFANAKAESANPIVAESLIDFESRHSNLPLADRVDLIVSDICSAGLLVPDPVGGDDFLRFAHKQFYEYYVAWVVLERTRQDPQDAVLHALVKTTRLDLYSVISTVPISCKFFCQSLNDNMSSKVSIAEQYTILINSYLYYYTSRLNLNIAKFVLVIMKMIFPGFDDGPTLGGRSVGFHLFGATLFISNYSIFLFVSIFTTSTLVTIVLGDTHREIMAVLSVAVAAVSSALYLSLVLNCQRAACIKLLICAWGKKFSKLETEDKLLLSYLLVSFQRKLPNLGLNDIELREKISHIRKD